MSSKMGMPEYTKVGFVAKHEMHRSVDDGKIRGEGERLTRTGGERQSYYCDRIEEGRAKDGKIHSTGIPLSHGEFGVKCAVPKGEMRGKGDTKRG